jgi:hypothetical protein
MTMSFAASADAGAFQFDGNCIVPVFSPSDGAFWHHVKSLTKEQLQNWPRQEGDNGTFLSFGARGMIRLHNHSGSWEFCGTEDK